MENIVERIKRNEESLTKTHRLVADYILAQYNDVAFCTLAELAGRIGVSTPTVIRFARALGYRGFTDMQQDIQGSVRDKVSLPKRMRIVREQNDELLRQTFETDINNLQQTLRLLSSDTLTEAIGTITDARSVYILGVRSTFSLAHLLFLTLSQVKSDVHLVHGTGYSFPEEVINMGPEDVCIAFLFPRYVRLTTTLLGYLRDTGVRVILITNPSFLPVQQYGDLILPCQVDGVSFKDSYAAPLSLVNYLVAAVASRIGDEAADNLEKTEAIFDRGHYFDR